MANNNLPHPPKCFVSNSVWQVSSNTHTSVTQKTLMLCNLGHDSKAQWCMGTLFPLELFSDKTHDLRTFAFCELLKSARLITGRSSDVWTGRVTLLPTMTQTSIWIFPIRTDSIPVHQIKTADLIHSKFR